MTRFHLTGAWLLAKEHSVHGDGSRQGQMLLAFTLLPSTEDPPVIHCVPAGLSWWLLGCCLCPAGVGVPRPHVPCPLVHPACDPWLSWSSPGSTRSSSFPCCESSCTRRASPHVTICLPSCRACNIQDKLCMLYVFGQQKQHSS